MPVFTATAAYIAAYAGVTSAVGIAAINFGVRVLATYMVSGLLGNRDNNQPTPIQDNGSRVQLPPATDNKLPVIYGTSFVSPAIIDAKISLDNKTMWYVMALSETTDSGSLSFNRAWWGDKELIFDTTDKTRVVKWINSSDQENTNVDGNMYVYFYKDGSYNPVNTSLSAIQVLQDANIAEEEQWTNSHLMSKTAFAIVKINYSQTSNIVGLEQFKVQLSNTLTKPGSVIKDYLLNDRYGCAIPLANIDQASLLELDDYSDITIPYTNTLGVLTYQPRYRINGPVSTNNPCLTNLQQLVDACDSWLQWDETLGQWSVTINRSYLDYTTYDDLFVVDSSNIIGGVDVTPVDLNSTYNQIEAQFPNNKIKDQTDYVYVTVDPEDMSPNEPENKLTIQLPQVNNSVQAEYLATRRLIQSREDLIVNFTMDYSGIQLEAGDVIRVRHPVYGWGPIDSNPTNLDKLFRINQVSEVKDEAGNLGAKLSLVEYNDQVYQNISIHDYTPASNSGIPDPSWISQPGAPTVTMNDPTSTSNVASFNVSATVPATGSVLYMDFYYGTSSDSSTHKLYKTVTPSNGRQFVNGETVTIHVSDLPTGTYYWSVKARSATQSSSSTPSNSSEPSSWSGPAILKPLLIGGALLGGIGKELLLPDTGAGYKKAIIFNPQAGPPVDISSTSQRNIPLIIPGITVTYSDVYPYETGTIPGMTAPWIPPYAGVVSITEGTDGWYRIMVWDTSDDKIATNEMGMVNMQLGIISDTPNTEIQICNYLVFNGDDAGTYQLQTPVLFGYSIREQAPYPYALTYNDVGQGDDEIVEWGYMIRSITGGSTITVYSGYGVLQQIPVNIQGPT